MSRIPQRTRTREIGKWYYARTRTTGSIPAPFFGDHRVGFTHAHKDGSPVLRGESSWRTICGFYVNHPRGFFMVQFRGFWK